jgi:hypothetical protein
MSLSIDKNKIKEQLASLQPVSGIGSINFSVYPTLPPTAPSPSIIVPEAIEASSTNYMMPPELVKSYERLLALRDTIIHKGGLLSEEDLERAIAEIRGS